MFGVIVTGPGPGKLKVDAKTILVTAEGFRVLDAEVYIHLKGYSLARVTHLDIETPVLNELLPPKHSIFLPVTGTGEGIMVHFDRMIKGVKLRVDSKMLAGRLLKFGEKTWIYVGGKVGGIFLGFKRDYVRRLEKIAEEFYGLTPK